MTSQTPQVAQGSIRRLVVATTIGSFSLAALMGILALLGGGDFGETQTRVLLTTLVVGLTSVAVLCYLATLDGPFRWVGALGGAVVVVPLLTSLSLIWADDSFSDSDGLWKAFGVGVVVAATLAQASLLLALAGARAALRPLLLGTLAMAGIVALFVCSLIVSSDDGGDLWRLIGIVAILDVLGTVTTIGLATLGARGDQDGGVARNGTPSPAAALPAPLAVRLDEYVARTGRARSEVVAAAITHYLDAAGTGQGAERAGADPSGPGQSGM